MKISRLIIFLFLTTFLLTPVFAGGGGWTLQECIEYSFRNNITIKQSQLSTLIGKNNLLQSQLNFLPSISGDASVNFNYGNSIDPTTYQYINSATNSNSFSLNANLPIWTGMQQINNVKKNQFDLEASRQDLENAKNNTALTITSYFLQIIQNKELLQVSKNQLELSNQQLDRTKLQIKSGALPAGNILQAESQIANDELRVVTAENALEIAKLSLKLLLQLQPEEAFDIVVPEKVEPAHDLDVTASRVYAFAEMNQPSIRSTEQRLRSSEQSLKVVKGTFSPTLSAYASVRTNYFSGSKQFNSIQSYKTREVGFVESSFEPVVTLDPVIDYKSVPYGKQLKNNLTEAMGISMNVPILSNYRRITNFNNAKLNVVNAQLNLESAKNRLKQDIYQAHANMINAAKTFEANKKNVESLEKSYEFAMERYNVGALAAIDLNTVKNNLATAQSELTKAKYDYIFKQKILDFYQGKALVIQ